MSEALTTESATITLPVPKVEVDSNLQHLLNHLADEGFRPKIDDDGSIGFKCEGWKLYLDPYPNQGGFRLYCCVYWELEPVDRTQRIELIHHEPQSQVAIGQTHGLEDREPHPGRDQGA